MRNIMRRKDGTPSYYAFVCGNVLTKKIYKDDNNYIRVELYKEAGCNVWQIIGYNDQENSFYSERLFWDTIDTTMSDALKCFKTRLKEYKTN